MFKSQESDRNKWGLWIFWMKLQNALIEIVYRRIRKISKVLKNKSWLRHFLKRRNSNPPLRGPWPFLQSTLPTETGDLQRIEIFCLYSSSECCMSIVFTNAETQLYWKNSDFASKMKSVRLSFQSFYGWPMVSIFAKPVFHMMMHAMDACQSKTKGHYQEFKIFVYCNSYSQLTRLESFPLLIKSLIYWLSSPTTNRYVLNSLHSVKGRMVWPRLTRRQ